MSSEDIYDEYYDGYEEAEGFYGFVAEATATLPWWLLSCIAHVTLILLASLVQIEEPPENIVIEIETDFEFKKLDRLKKEIQPEEIYRKMKPVEYQEPQMEEPVVKDFKEADKNQDDGHHTDNPKGNKDHVANSPFEGDYQNLAIGIGNLAGGTFGGRFSGRHALVKKYGGSPQTEEAVQRGLIWLKRHQSDDGRWDSDGFVQHCGSDPEVIGKCSGQKGFPQYDPAMTGLALLCYLGAGNTSKVGEFQEQVRKATRYLAKIQTDDGCFGSKDVRDHMYNHAIATLAMSEAYALSNHNPLLKKSAQRGIDFLIKAQTPYRGWGYTSKPGDDDTSVMGWCVMALRSAQKAGLNVPLSAFTGAKDFLNEVTSPEFRTGFRKRNGKIEFEQAFTNVFPLFPMNKDLMSDLSRSNVTPRMIEIFRENGIGLSNHATIDPQQQREINSALGSSKKDDQITGWLIEDPVHQKQYFVRLEDRLYVARVAETFAASEAMTAASVTCRVFMGERWDSLYISEGAKLLGDNLPSWGNNSQGESLINYYYWYYGTLAMYQVGGKHWSRWNEQLKNVLLNSQEKEGCAAGSWPAVGKRCKAGGTIYATTLSILSLEIYYRYDKVFK